MELGSNLFWEVGREVWSALEPPPKHKAVDWIPRHVRVPASTESPGPYDLELFPYVRGVLEAVDDPDVRVIYLRWATRNGKTMLTVALLCYFTATAERPMMFCSSDKPRASDTIDNLLYPALEECEETSAKLLPEHKRNQTEVRVGNALVRRAYAGSASTLAGFPCMIGIGNEVGLWPLNMVQRFKQRARLFPFTSKYILEGKPESVGKCAISSLADAETTQRRYFQCACPHCGKYQRIVWGWGKPGGGVKWNVRDDGVEDPQLAIETAHYECVKGCRIDDDTRGEFLRTGKWVAEGQRITKTGKLVGKPKIGPKNVAFDGLSSLYSQLVDGWGQLVSEWFECKADPEARREFITGTLAEQYDPAPPTATADEVIERLGVDEPARLCPLWSRFLTLGIDVGKAGDTYIFYWVVIAWGQHQRGQIIDYGVEAGEDELTAKLSSGFKYDHADGGRPLRPIGAAIDSGSYTNWVYDFANSIPGLWPVKGSNHDSRKDFNKGEAGYSWFKPSVQQTQIHPAVARARKLTGQFDLLIPNTHRTQLWLEDRLNGIVKASAPQALTIPFELFVGYVLGVDLVHHLNGDFLHEGSWKKRYEDQDFRDAIRYAAIIAHKHRPTPKHWARDDVRALLPAPDREEIDDYEIDDEVSFVSER